MEWRAKNYAERVHIAPLVRYGYFVIFVSGIDCQGMLFFAKY